MEPKSDARRTLNWFVEKVEVQLEERSLFKSGYSPITFFDTYDVQASLLGFRDLLLPQGEKFDERKFEKKSALVHALAAAGWLGPMEMLVPHQAEFLRKLNSDFFGVPSFAKNITFKDWIGKFFEQLRIDRNWILTGLSRLKNEDRAEYINKSVGSTERLFKAVQLSSGTWRIRLSRWGREGILPLSQNLGKEMDFGRVVESDRFKEILRLLNRRRSGFERNNFSDAMALEELANHVERLEVGDSNRIPLFFSPDSVFERVISEVGLDDDFSFNIGGLKRRTVIRDSEYFVFRAIFQPQADSLARINEVMPRLLDEHWIRELSGEIRMALEVVDDSTIPDLLLKTDIGGGLQLQNLIDHLRTLTFLDKVWLPFAEKDVSRSELEAEQSVLFLAGLDKGSELWGNPFKVKLDQELEEMGRRIRENIEIYKSTSDFWIKLDKAAVNFRKKYKSKFGAEQSFRMSLHRGLVRFAFSSESRAVVDEILGHFLGDKKSEFGGRIKTVEMYQNLLRRSVDDEEILESAMTICGVLWCLRSYRQVAKLSESIFEDRALRERAEADRLMPLKLIYLASMIEEAATDVSLERIGNHIDKIYNEMMCGSRRAPGLCSGMAYAYFHYGYRLKEGPSKRPAFNRYLETAIDLADNARTSDDREVRVYAINQCLYYRIQRIVLLGNWSVAKGEWGSISADSQLLMTFRGQPVWQYRYDDTLSRYNLLCAKLSESKREWTIYMRAARSSLKDAKINSFGDPFVSNLEADLHRSSSMGFELRRR